ncbi:MAG: hypothetical protein ABSF26_05180 [Thermoguttaceae bacterium]|jgi:hypothetical protein
MLAAFHFACLSLIAQQIAPMPPAAPTHIPNVNNQSEISNKAVLPLIAPEASFSGGKIQASVPAIAASVTKRPPNANTNRDQCRVRRQ